VTNGVNAQKHVTTDGGQGWAQVLHLLLRTCLGTYQQLPRLLHLTPIFDNALRRWHPLSLFPLPIPVCNSSPMLPSSHDTRRQSKCATSYTVTPTPSPGRHYLCSTRQMQVGHRLWNYCSLVIYMPPNSVSLYISISSRP